jgi:hypothetical protein
MLQDVRSPKSRQSPTMSRLKQHMHLARLRVRGMAAIQYAVFLRALGLNILRVAACA